MPLIGTLNSFSNGSVADAGEVNQNFADVRTAFNDSAVLTDVAKTIAVTHVFTPSQTFTGGATFGAAVGITGALTVTGGLAVSGAVTGGTYNAQTIGAAASFTGSVAVATTLAVTGAATFSNKINGQTIGAAASLTGTLAVAGATTLSSTLTVTGGTRLNGALGIGAAALTSNGVLLQSSLSGNGSQAGFNSAATYGADATTYGAAVQARVTTAAAAFTMPSAYAFVARNPIIGAGSTITAAYGLYVENITTGGSNYSIYTGTAQSRFGGDVDFDTGILTLKTLSVTGSASGLAWGGGAAIASSDDVLASGDDATLGSLNLGGATLENILSVEALWDPGIVVAGGSATTTVAVVGAALGDQVIVNNVYLADSVQSELEGYVSATDVVTLFLKNNDTIDRNPVSRTVRVTVLKF